MVFLVGPLSASAQLTLPTPLQTNGLRGGRYVGSAGSIDSTPRLLAGVGFAGTEGVLHDGDRHRRLGGELAFAYAPWRSLQVSVGLDARYDAHRGRLGADHGFTVGSAIETRHAFALGKTFSLAGRTKLRFPPALSVAGGFRAVSPELGAIASAHLQDAGELSLELGYRFDRSARGVGDPTTLSRADLLGASLSRFDAALLGALYEVPLGPLLTSVECSWDVAVGASSPTAIQSPLRVRIAAQTRLARRFVPGVELGVSPSARPALETLARIEPRLWFALTLGVLFERTESAVEPVAASWDMGRAEPLSLRIMDPAGQPLHNVTVARVEAPDEVLATSDELGTAQLALSHAQGHRLVIAGEGFEAQELSWEPGQQQKKRSITLVRVLREGEIKGTVRSLRGGLPLPARVTVQPLGKLVETDRDGNFVVGVPPGSYKLEISAPGHVTQRRTAQVERLGVTILVIDLNKAR